MRYLIFTLLIILTGFGIGFSKKNADTPAIKEQTLARDSALPSPTVVSINQPLTGKAAFEVNPDNYVAFAKTLIGTPYVYGSVDPARGFDCSGFINYVSKHFGMKVPRSSVEFTNFGTTVDATAARPGDLILFTGTDASRRVVGHMGIITENNGGEIEFIHSSSGKGKGVVISGLEGYYQTRFVKVIRIFTPTRETAA